MSKEYVRAVLEMPKESASGLLRMLLLAIAEHANENGYASPGNKLLAEETTISERQIQRMIPQLANAGILEIVENGNGRGRTRIMRLLFEPAAIIYKRTFEAKKGDTISHPLPEKRMTNNGTLYPLNGEKGDKKGDKRVTSDEERVTFEAKKGDMLPEVEADNLTTKPITTTKNLVERDQGNTAGAREGNGTASLSQPKFAQSSQPLVPHKPRMDGNGTSAKSAQPPLETDSPHLDPRRFVNGYIRPGTGDNPVEAFYERHSIREHRLSAPMEDDIAKAVTDLDLWRKTLAEWDRHGYRPSNIQGQLEWYANGGKANASGSNKRTDSGTRTTQDGYIDLATYTSGRPLPPVNRIKH